jgi:hypothetical protein
VAAWLAGGALRRGYDPVEQAISRLAESGAPTRVLMTAGFGGLAAGMLVAARPLARHVGRSAGLAIAGTALTTVGVALTPLHGDARNTPHTLFAVAGYGTLAAAPLLAAPCFGRTGRRRSAALSVLAGVASAALLTASGSSSASGLLQRAGLTVGHTWLAVTSGAIATGRLGPASSGAVTPAPRLQ